MGSRGGRPAAGLVPSTVCYYCIGGCSALVVCARRSLQVWGVGAGAGSRFSPGAPPCPRVPRGACCGLSRPVVPSLRLPVRHSMRSVRSAGSVPLPFGFAARVRCVCVRSSSRDVHASPARVGVARALRAVPMQGSGRALPGGSCPSAFPAPVPYSPYLALWGVGPVPSFLAWLGVARPPAAGFARCGGGTWAPGGRASRSECGASGVGRPPTPHRPSLGCAAGARYPLAVGARAVGEGTRDQRHSARSWSWLCAPWGRHGCARGGVHLAWL